MSLVSFSFFGFLLVCLVVYYLAGEKSQKYIILLASLIFFLSASAGKELQMLGMLAYVVVLTYGGALLISRLEGRGRLWCATGVISLLVVNLVVLKYVYNLGELFLSLFRVGGDISWLQFAAPIGISYFTLSAIGYLMEVYWKNYEPERNFVVIADFICFFPQIVSGPVARYGDMAQQYRMKHRLDYENIRNGAIRMLWGYFKKLVIADRVALVVQTVYGSYENRSTWVILFAMLCYAVQLYTDFSGCMDIILGAAKLFGITPPENFDAPFFSRTVPEFWRRWHITLGAWFKDFVMYPVLKTHFFVNLGKKAKKRLGKKLGKKVPTYLSLLIVWFLLGLWHGGIAYFFMASAMIPCMYLILGDFFQPLMERINQALHIPTEHPLWIAFQRIRTSLLICVCWIFICTESVSKGFHVLKCLFTNMTLETNLMAVLAESGIGMGKLLILLLGLLLLFLVDYMQNRKVVLTDFLYQQWPVVRWGILYLCAILILFYGMVGGSSFIYFQF